MSDNENEQYAAHLRNEITNKFATVISNLDTLSKAMIAETLTSDGKLFSSSRANLVRFYDQLSDLTMRLLVIQTLVNTEQVVRDAANSLEEADKRKKGGLKTSEKEVEEILRIIEGMINRKPLPRPPSVRYTAICDSNEENTVASEQVSETTEPPVSMGQEVTIKEAWERAT